MAARKSNALKSDFPVVRHLRYELTNSSEANTETSHFIDLARDLSRVNRRLMRQGRVYHIKRITVVSTNTAVSPPQNAGFLSVSAVPFSWVATGAWKRGFTAWSNMNKDAMRKTNDIQGTWADFKVFMTETMRTSTLLQPLDNGSVAYLPGEWDYSRYVAPTAAAGVIDEYTCHMLGAHTGAPGAYTSIGLIQSFGDARATVSTFDPSVPPTVDDDPLVNLFDYGDTQNQIVANLDQYNDNSPYDHFEYPGDDANGSKPMVMAHSAIPLGSSVMNGFTAVCGLLELEAKSPIASDVYSVLIELAPGKYRGIKAETI